MTDISLAEMADKSPSYPLFFALVKIHFRDRPSEWATIPCPAKDAEMTGLSVISYGSEE